MKKQMEKEAMRNLRDQLVLAALILVMWGVSALYGAYLFYEREGGYTVTLVKDGITRTYYVPPIKKEISWIRASYEIGAYAKDPDKYGYQCIDMGKMNRFLKSIPEEHFMVGDIIEVDGLKWKKSHTVANMLKTKGVTAADLKNIVAWIPHPNPPIPKLEKGEDAGKHIREYAQWIEDHPHFGFPPLPPVHKEVPGVQEKSMQLANQ